MAIHIASLVNEAKVRKFAINLEGVTIKSYWDGLLSNHYIARECTG
jgi:hypothetical protein